MSAQPQWRWIANQASDGHARNAVDVGEAAGDEYASIGLDRQGVYRAVRA
jgi:hypothetical protein